MKTRLNKNEINQVNLIKFFKSIFKYKYRDEYSSLIVLQIKNLLVQFGRTYLHFVINKYNDINIEYEDINEIFINQTEDGELLLQINSFNGLTILLDEHAIELKDKVKKVLYEQ